MINGVDWCSGRDWVCEGVVRELGTIVKGRINQGTTRRHESLRCTCAIHIIFIQLIQISFN